jgi:hypothetical protein
LYTLKLLLPSFVLIEGTKKKSLLSAAIIGVVIVVFSQLEEWCADDNVSAQISFGFNRSLKL